MRRPATRFELFLTVVTIAVSLGATACSAGFPTGITMCENKDPVASIRMEPSQLTLPVGGTAQFTATVVFANGKTNPACPLEPAWTSSNVTVASVYFGGGVRGDKPGTSYVAARAGGKADSVLVTVIPAP
jgi:uncharacterized protein YjdB